MIQCYQENLYFLKIKSQTQLSVMPEITEPLLYILLQWMQTFLENLKLNMKTIVLSILVK